CGALLIIQRSCCRHRSLSVCDSKNDRCRRSSRRYPAFMAWRLRSMKKPYPLVLLPHLLLRETCMADLTSFATPSMQPTMCMKIQLKYKGKDVALNKPQQTKTVRL